MQAKNVDNAILVVRSALDSGVDWVDLERLVAAEKAAGNPVASLIHSLQLEHRAVTLRLRDVYAAYDSDELASSGDEGAGAGAGAGAEEGGEEGGAGSGKKKQQQKKKNKQKQQQQKNNKGKKGKKGGGGDGAAAASAIGENPLWLNVRVNIDLSAQGNAAAYFADTKAARVKEHKTKEGGEKALKAATK